MVAGALMFGSFCTSVFAVGSNGSFEIGTDPGLFTPLGVGSTNITDWSVDSGNNKSDLSDYDWRCIQSHPRHVRKSDVPPRSLKSSL